MTDMCNNKELLDKLEKQEQLILKLNEKIVRLEELLLLRKLEEHMK